MTRETTILTVLGYIFGAGGLLSFFINMKNAKHQENQDAAQSWHELYEATLKNVSKVETENQNLRQKVEEMQTKILRLTIELESYKRFERYVTELEVYSTSLLRALQPLVTADAFQKLEAGRPVRVKIDPEDIVDPVEDKEDEEE